MTAVSRVRDWNVVASVREPNFREARDLLGELGEVGTTDYYNVLVLRVEAVGEMLERLRARCAADPHVLQWLGHVVPATVTFAFQSPQEFEDRAREALLAQAGQLAGHSFHIRIERRGFKGRLDAGHEERLLGEAVLAAAGRGARVTFEDPDVIVAIETVGQRAGLSLWSRALRARYPFLRLP